MSSDRTDDPGGGAWRASAEASARELVNAILYFLRAGAAWRLLPP